MKINLGVGLNPIHEYAIRYRVVQVLMLKVLVIGLGYD